MRLGWTALELRRFAARLALFAILLHLFVAATHHHAVHLRAAPALDVAAASGITTTIERADGPAVPGSDQADEACPVCLGLSMGAAFLLPAVIVLAQPARADLAPWRPAMRPAAWRIAPFQPRGPPLTLTTIA